MTTKKNKKKTPYYAEIIADCYTAEEYDIMILIIVLCQHYYRSLKKNKQKITISRVITKALPEIKKGGKLCLKKKLKTIK